MSESPERPVHGCYGLVLHGLSEAAPHMVNGAVSWPVVVVQQIRKAPGNRPDEYLDADTAILHLSDGTGFAELVRGTGGVVLHTDVHYDDESLLHPMLSSSCAIMNRWSGRDSFHAGAFELGGRAWAIIGDRGQGKSTTLGFLAKEGETVIVDDLIVEEDGYVFVGPRFVDLRPDAAAHLGVGRDVGRLGARERFRYYLPGTDFERIPLAGWIVLAWGDTVSLTALPAPERISVLYDNRVVRRHPLDAGSYLRHAARPFYRLTRPQSWDSLPAVWAALSDRLA